MIKLFMLCLVSVSLVSCGKSGGGGGSSSGNEISMEDISTEMGVPAAAMNFNTNIRLIDVTNDQQDKILAAAELIKKVVVSDEFKNQILNHTYKGKKTFVDNGGLSNAQIYKKILEGAETLQPSVDNEMDLELEPYRASNNTVGYTYPNSERVWMNEKYLNKYSATKVTTNMMHEWLHKLGFKHDANSTPSRPYSVPYAIGYLVAKLAKQY